MKPTIRTPKSVYFTIGAGFALGAACMAAVFSGNALPSVIAQSQPALVQPRLVSSITSEDMSALRSLDASFANLAEYASAAVVDITAVRERTQGKDGRRVPISQGEGSGFIFQADGYILTNDHVVGDADRVTVRLKDGREFPGKVTRAPEMDIALVKIEANNLPTLAFADSSTVKPGQLAMALGAPFGLENTVTIGHVSALQRSEQVIQDKVYADLIQTDASINRGNSGGPLINIEGQVIGVNSAIFSPSGTSAGIGFAIPSNQAKFIADILLDKGKVTRAFLGVRMESLKEFEKAKLNVPGGAKVLDPGPDSADFRSADTPAGKAGIKPGDVIVKVGDRDVKSSVDLRNSMLVYAPGSKVTVEYLRGTERKSTTVTLTTPPALPTAPKNRFDSEDSFGFPIPEEFRRRFPNLEQIPEVGPESDQPRLGVNVVDPTEEMRKQFNIPDDAKGAVVLSVTPGSRASTIGMEPGDLVTKINGESITNSEALVQRIQKVKKGDTLKVSYRRFRSSGNTDVEVTVNF
jgi:serine protease Do